MKIALLIAGDSGKRMGQEIPRAYARQYNIAKLTDIVMGQYVAGV